MIRNQLSLALAYAIQAVIAKPKPKQLVLTAEAEHERMVFDREFDNAGCTCFISPPCSRCTHPGNPDNQAEDETCWEYV